MRRAARFLNARVERRVAACESVDGQCADDDGCVEQGLRAKQPVEREREAQLRAVDQRQTFLRFERERREAGGLANLRSP